MDKLLPLVEYLIRFNGPQSYKWHVSADSMVVIGSVVTLHARGELIFAADLKDVTVALDSEHSRSMT